MPAKYSIKRNSLSSKWGVWTNGTDTASTVDQLVAELRSNEEAESYCVRIQAGETHEAIVASFSAKKPKKEGSGILGRFRKKSSEQSDSAAVTGAVNNPVIEIETVEPKTAVQENASPETEVEQLPVKAPEAPSRYEVIEQTRPVREVVPEPPKVVEPESVLAPEPVVPPSAETESAPEKQPEPVSAPLADVEPVSEPEPAVSVSEPMPAAKAEPEAVPAPVIESKPEPEPTPAPKAETEAVPAPATQPEPEPGPMPMPVPAPRVEKVPSPAPSVSASDDTESERVKTVASPASLSDKVKAMFGKSKAAAVPVAPEVTELAPEQAAPAVPTDKQSLEISPKTPDVTVGPSDKAEIPVTEARLKARKKPEAAAREQAVPQQPEPLPEPLKEQKTAEIETAPVQKADSASPTSDQDDDLLVDWTFTPPPDITPEELKASGKNAQEAATPVAPEQEPVEKPEAARAPVEKAMPAKPPATESPAADSARQELATASKTVTAPAPVASQPKQVEPELAKPVPVTPVPTAPSTSKLTVDIGISKALKEVTTGDPRVSDKRYNSVASKEYTEVNKAFTTGNSPETLHEELMHLAAVCLAWADAIEKRQAGKQNRKAA